MRLPTMRLLFPQSPRFPVLNNASSFQLYGYYWYCLIRIHCKESCIIQFMEVLFIIIKYCMHRNPSLLGVHKSKEGIFVYSFFPLTVITQISAIFPFFKLSPVSNENFIEDFVGDGREDLHDTSYSRCFIFLP